VNYTYRKDELKLKNWFVEHKFYLLVAAFILFGSIYFFYSNQPNLSSNQTINKLERKTLPDTDQNTKAKPEPESQTKPVETIMVDIKGEIKKPGVYQSSQGERVIDVINRAGGLTNKADESQINFAAHVQDEMVINIPTKGQINANPPLNSSVPTSTGNNTNPNTNKINLNKADENELQNLPGIGPSKAAAIISYRNENGLFQTVDDLKKISGIGDKTFEKLKELIIVQ
jgi:competence protein ComEA